jgi:hypothetical protein
MSKIKGWRRDTNTGDIEAWVTINRPYLNVWIVQIFGKNGLWEVNNNFAVPSRMAFKSKKEALNEAYKIMRENP